MLKCFYYHYIYSGCYKCLKKLISTQTCFSKVLYNQNVEKSKNISLSFDKEKKLHQAKLVFFFLNAVSGPFLISVTR
jgi:hypothetical protein